MVFRLELRFSSPEQLALHLRRYADLGGVLIPERLCPEVPDWVELEFVLGRQRAVARGPVLRRERLGILVELSREALREAFAMLPDPLPREPQPARGVALGRLGAVKGAAAGAPLRETVRPGAMPTEEEPQVVAGDLPPAARIPAAEVPEEAAVGDGEPVSQRTLFEPLDEVEEEWPEEPQTPGAAPAEEAPEIDLAGEGMDEFLVEEEAAESAGTPAALDEREEERLHGRAPSASTEPGADEEAAGSQAAAALPPAPAAELPVELGPEELLRLACEAEGRDPARVLAIVRHPRASRALAVRLLGRLGPDELAQVAEDPDLPAAVRRHAGDRSS